MNKYIIKYILILFLLYFSNNNLFSNNIIQYEYWYDGNYLNKISVQVPQDSLINIQTNISVSELSTGFHVFHIRFQDSLNKWSSPINQFFYKPNYLITNYEYWFDDNYNNKYTSNLNNDDTINIISNINIPNMSIGLHAFHVRFQSSDGSWSCPTNNIFFNPGEYINGFNKIIAYEYWLDGKIDEKISSVTSDSDTAHIITNIDLSNLSNGMHIFHVRFKDLKGLWSNVLNTYFLKPNEYTLGNNKITQYKYWFDNDLTNIHTINLNYPVDTLDIIRNLLVPNLTLSTHYLKVQFKDQAGNWSEIIPTQFTYLGGNPSLPTPVLIEPLNQALNISKHPNFKWNPSSGADYYRLQVSKDINFSDLIFNDFICDTNYLLAQSLFFETQYYWHVRAYAGNFTSEWSETWSFTTLQAPATQQIDLIATWNMISSRVVPDDLSMNSIFYQLGSNFLIAKDYLGNVFWPEWGIDDIGLWNISQGYQVYVINPDVLIISGDSVNPMNHPINLPVSWGLISYLRTSPMESAIALASINGSFLILKDNLGNVYWPEWGIDDIGFMLEGQGYQIYMNQPAVLIYPGN